MGRLLMTGAVLLALTPAEAADRNIECAATLSIFDHSKDLAYRTFVHMSPNDKLHNALEFHRERMQADVAVGKYLERRPSGPIVGWKLRRYGAVARVLKPEPFTALVNACMTEAGQKPLHVVLIPSAAKRRIACAGVYAHAFDLVADGVDYATESSVGNDMSGALMGLTASPEFSMRTFMRAASYRLTDEQGTAAILELRHQTRKAQLMNFETFESELARCKANLNTARDEIAEGARKWRCEHYSKKLADDRAQGTLTQIGRYIFGNRRKHELRVKEDCR